MTAERSTRDVPRQRRRAAERRAARLLRGRPRPEPRAARVREARAAAAAANDAGALDWHEAPRALPDGPVTRAFIEYIRGVEADDELPEHAVASTVEYQLRSRSRRTLEQNETTWRTVLRAHAGLGVRATLPMTARRASAIIGWCADAGYAYGTICNVRTVIGLMHRYAGHADPCVSRQVALALAGVARTIGSHSPHAKDAVTVEEVKAMAALAADHPLPMKGLLDVAVLLLLFASAARRAEFARLRRDEVDIQRSGVEIVIVSSKTSRNKPQSVWVERTDGLETCPVGALERWIDGAGIRKGWLFRHVDRRGAVQPRPMSDKYMSRAVLKYVAGIGLDATRYGCHSMRAGLITSAIETRQISEEQLMAHTRHREVDTLLRYYRPKHRRSLNLTRAVGL